MKRLLIIPVILLLLCACESRLDKAIPQSSLVGAVSNIDVNLDGQGEWADRQKCIDKPGWCWKSKDWTILKVDALIPYNIKREQVRPTLLVVFKKVEKECPKCNRIYVSLAQDKEMAEAYQFVGRLEYIDSKIVICYGIPSDKQMEEQNALIGKSFSTKGRVLGMPGDENKIFKYQYDDTRLFRPDFETYTSYKRILMSEDDIKLHEKASEKKSFNSIKEYYADMSNKISKKTGLPVKDIDAALHFMHKYYHSCLGYGWDNESIDIPL